VSLEYVIQRAVDNVYERLAGVELASPAFAVALFSEDPEALFAANITIGLDRDRPDALRGVFGAARLSIWSAYEFGAAAPHPPQLDGDPEFVRAQAAVLADLYERDIEPLYHVLNRVAAQIDPRRLPFPVTEDFITYAYAEDAYELVENIRWSAGPERLRLLEAEGLVVDLPPD
jgi:hypothetical protein